MKDRNDLWIRLGLAAALTLATCGAAAEPELSVTAVRPGEEAARAGIARGDLIEGWREGEGPSTSFSGVFDFLRVQRDLGPGGAVSLSASRAGAAFEAPLGPCRWGIEVARSAPPTEGSPEALYSLGISRMAAQDFTGARAAFEAAREAAFRSGDALAEGFCWEATGASWAAENRLEDAARAYGRALELWERRDPQSLLASLALEQLGVLAFKMKRAKEAAERFERGAALARERAPRSSALAQHLLGLGRLRSRTGEQEEAAGLFEEAADLERVCDPEGVPLANALNNTGLARLYAGDLRAAEEALRESLRLKEAKAPGSLSVANTLDNLGIAARRRGNYLDAEFYQSRAVALYAALDPKGRDYAIALGNLADLASARRDEPSAERYYRENIALLETEGGDPQSLAKALNNFGGMLVDHDRWSEGLPYLDKALALKRKVSPDTLELGATLTVMGLAHLKAGDLEAAAPFLREGLALRERKGPGTLDLAHSLIGVGALHQLRGEAEASLEAYRRAAAIQAQLAPGSGELSESLYCIGVLLEGAGKPREAEASLLESVQVLEAQRQRLGGGREAGERFSAHYAEVYRVLLRVQVALGKKQEAFHTLERFRAQSLLALLAERDLDFQKDAPPELLRRQRRLAAEYDRVLEHLGGLSLDRAEERGEARAELDRLRAAREALDEEIRRASPRLAALQQPRPLHGEQVSRLLSPGDLLLSFCSGETSLHLFSLLDGTLQVHTLPLPRADLARRVRLYRTMLSDPAVPEAELARRGAKLRAELLGPVEASLRKARRVMLCLDGPLHLLPFSALGGEDGSLLGAQKPLSTVASATVFGELSRRPPRPGAHRAAVFAAPATEGGSSPVVRALSAEPLPPLPATLEEASALSALYGPRAEVRTGEEATEAAVRRAAGSVHLLHLACHALFQPLSPLDSGLVLSPPSGESPEDNGVLQAWEVFEGVRLDADLVALSACQTALGEDREGEGLVGLTRAFQYAGARAVLASLWSVDDRSTAKLMARFYKGLEAGKPADQALRDAQRAAVKAGVPRAYWSAFVLVGAAF